MPEAASGSDDENNTAQFPLDDTALKIHYPLAYVAPKNSTGVKSVNFKLLFTN